MWSFLSAIFNKIASVAVAVLVAAGLVSAPLPPVSEAPVAATSSQEIVQETALSQPEKEEKPVVSTAAHSASSGQAKTEKAEIEEKLAQTAQLLEALKKASPPPAPSPTPQYFTTPTGITLDKFGNPVNTSGSISGSPAPATAPLPQGTFRLPNGALVDANGNIIQPAPPSTNTTSNQTSSSDNYALGSTINLSRNTLTTIDFNSNLDCEALSLSSADIKKCQLYRASKGDYNWSITD
ncbi:MAG: hypothetical protein A2909_00905 [Candidatus Tagabacteria bacterium RIFCSPLOWO2_01_FULL_39_11]|uniref:Uncharacterized protein n=1 Tax=Candidatus Tagabacteria bacterium RIFCSPLOWO2_01_FULL_39_11 TaxID=1802295 RepID=A0A1G2LQE7_9BACT|nr:MAG: hypothetical protein A2909_00905 [Candidatus Tagabacteria bacterium RIFCSPLOWO2_01_FULL_39_11]